MNIQSLHSLCPAAFATEPSTRVSSSYTFIPSAPVVERLYNEGFECVSVKQKRGHSRQFGTHLLRFRHPSVKPIDDFDTIPEVVLLNNHEATRRFILTIGLFRLVCSNGLTVTHWSGQGAVVKRIHTGSIDYINQVMSLIERMPTITDTLQQMSARQLNYTEQCLLVREGMTARDHAVVVANAYNADDYLKVRRQQDHGNDLWHVLNRVQENLVHTTERGITEPNRLHNINTALWSTAMSFINN